MAYNEQMQGVSQLLFILTSPLSLAKPFYMVNTEEVGFVGCIALLGTGSGTFVNLVLYLVRQASGENSQ